MKPLHKAQGTAIVGRLVTANLGIEKVIRNIISNPNIRYLLLCGKESPVFHPGQTLECLFKKGVDPEKRIIGAEGHYPVLTNIGREHISQFRNHIELVDCIGEVDIGALKRTIETLVARSTTNTKPKQANPDITVAKNAGDSDFTPLRPGGPRGTPTYDPKGFFIVTVDREAGKIVLRHYQSDNTPAHEMRGQRAEAMVRGLVREGLISQLSHAGYLGVELAKAETALRLGVDYEQDHPIRP